MAKLGDIQYTNIDQGAVAPSTGRGLTQAVGQALDFVATQHVNNVMGNLDTDMRDVISEIRGTATADGDPTLEDLGSLAQGDTPEAKDVWIRLGKLQAVKRKGSSQQAALADLELKRLLDKYSVEHPRLAQALQAQYGMTVRASSQLAELNMIDEMNAVQAKQAQEEWQDIVDWAYKPVSEKGLGIPRTIDPRSGEFASLVARRSEDYALNQAHELAVQTAVTSVDMSSRGRSQALNAALQGHGNSISRFHETNKQALMDYRAEMLKPAGQRDDAWIQEFQEGVAPGLIEGYKLQMATLRSTVEAAFPTIESRATPHYKETQAWVEGVQKEVDMYVAAITGVADDPSAIDRFLGASQLRYMEILKDSSYLDAWEVMWNPNQLGGMKDFYETMSKYNVTGSAIATMGTMSEKLNTISADYFGRLGIPEGEHLARVGADAYAYGGMGTITSTDTPEEMERKLRNNMRSGRKPHLYEGSNDANDDIKTALHHINVLKQATTMSDDTDSPHTLNQFLLQGANAFLSMATLGNPHPEAIEESLGVLADPAILNGMELVASPELSSPRITLANSADKFFGMTRPAERRETVMTSWQRPIWKGISAFDLVDVVTTEGDNPELTFSVDRELVKQALEAARQSDPFPMPVTDEKINDEILYIDGQIRPMINKVNTDIRATAHIDALKERKYDRSRVDYIFTANELGWMDFFLGGN